MNNCRTFSICLSHQMKMKKKKKRDGLLNQLTWPLIFLHKKRCHNESKLLVYNISWYLIPYWYLNSFLDWISLKSGNRVHLNMYSEVIGGWVNLLLIGGKWIIYRFFWFQFIVVSLKKNNLDITLTSSKRIVFQNNYPHTWNKHRKWKTTKTTPTFSFFFCENNILLFFKIDITISFRHYISELVYSSFYLVYNNDKNSIILKMNIYLCLLLSIVVCTVLDTI